MLKWNKEKDLKNTKAKKSIKASEKIRYRGKGAYRDSFYRAMRRNFGRAYNPKTCSQRCRGYRYFAIQDRNQCFCENDWRHATRYGRSRCGGNGGPWCNYIYQTWIEKTKAKRGEIPECEGDCDKDADCLSGLKCFQRNGNEKITGCKGKGTKGRIIVTIKKDKNSRVNNYYIPSTVKLLNVKKKLVNMNILIML